MPRMDAPSLPVLSVWTDADDSSRRLPGLEDRVPGCAASPAQALERAREQFPGRDVLLLRADAELPDGLWPRLEAAWREGDWDVLSVLDGSWPIFAAGLDTPARDTLAARAGDRTGVAWQGWSGICSLWRGSRLAGDPTAPGAGVHGALLSCIYVGPGLATTMSSLPPALVQLSERFAAPANPAPRDAALGLVDERDLEIARLEDYIRELDQQLADAHGYYQRDSVDLALQRDVAVGQRDEAEAVLRRIQGSLLWRLTAWPRRLLSSLHAMAIAAAYHVRHLRSLSARGLSSLRARGLAGTLERLRERRSKPVKPALPLTQAQNNDDSALRLPRHANPRASIIIPVYNQLHFTLACLRSLTACGDHASFEVIVVDDSSSDSTPRVVPSIPGLRYHRNPRNLGFIGACNAGAELANGDYWSSSTTTRRSSPVGSTRCWRPSKPTRTPAWPAASWCIPTGACRRRVASCSRTAPAGTTAVSRTLTTRATISCARSTTARVPRSRCGATCSCAWAASTATTPPPTTKTPTWRCASANRA